MDILVGSLVKSGLVVVMCRKAIVYDTLTGRIPESCGLDEFIGLIKLYFKSARETNQKDAVFSAP